MNLIQAVELKCLIHAHGEIALLDVREAGEFAEGHALFSVPAPYSRLEPRIVQLVPSRHSLIVLCDDGKTGIAQKAAERIEILGYTNVHVLKGGMRAWAEQGYGVFSGVNVPSKLFGEMVEQVYGTPHISAQDLLTFRANGAPHVVLDGRPFDEFQRMSIPGATSCPNGELVLHLDTLARAQETPIIVNCAGRTRSILGAQTLRNLGIRNPVYTLENGTPGWFLAGFPLDHGATSRLERDPEQPLSNDLLRTARALADRCGVLQASQADLEKWRKAGDRNVYVFDVRTIEEFQAGHLPSAVHAPGGQLVQATDQWIGVRNARVILYDSDQARAPVIASWLAHLGHEAYVLDGVTRELLIDQAPSDDVMDFLPQAPTAVSVDEMISLQEEGWVVFDLRNSMDYRQAHVPGSRWTIRPRIVQDASDLSTKNVVLVAEDTIAARLAAQDLVSAGVRQICMLRGGLDAWRLASQPLEATPNNPTDAECIDFIFFAHARHQGDREAAAQYLAWETDLISQVDAAERAMFHFPLSSKNQKHDFEQ